MAVAEQHIAETVVAIPRIPRIRPGPASAGATQVVVVVRVRKGGVGPGAVAGTPKPFGRRRLDTALRPTVRAVHGALEDHGLVTRLIHLIKNGGSRYSARSVVLVVSNH